LSRLGIDTGLNKKGIYLGTATAEQQLLSTFLLPAKLKATSSIDSIASVSTTINWACEADKKKIMLLWEGALGNGLGKKY